MHMFKRPILSIFRYSDLFEIFLRKKIIKIVKDKVKINLIVLKLYIKIDKDFIIYSIIGNNKKVFAHRKVPINIGKNPLRLVLTNRSQFIKHDKLLEQLKYDLKNIENLSHLNVYIKTKIPSQVYKIWETLKNLENYLKESINVFDSVIKFMTLRIIISYNGCTPKRRKRKRFRIFEKIKLRLTNSTFLDIPDEKETNSIRKNKYLKHTFNHEAHNIKMEKNTKHSFSLFKKIKYRQNKYKKHKPNMNGVLKKSYKKKFKISYRLISNINKKLLKHTKKNSEKKKKLLLKLTKLSKRKKRKYTNQTLKQKNVSHIKKAGTNNNNR